MKHIITAASRRLARASLTSGDLSKLSKVFKELETLCGEDYFKNINSLPYQGEYPYSLERKADDSSLSDELEELIETLRHNGWHPIKQKEHRGVGWDKWAFQKEDQFLKLGAHKTLGRGPLTKNRMLISAIFLVPVLDLHVWDMSNDIEEE